VARPITKKARPDRAVPVRPSDGAVGVFIRSAREQAGLSQRQVARSLGVSEATVWRWETGDQRLMFSWAIQLLQLYAGWGTIDGDETGAPWAEVLGSALEAS
jgi:transcriptional regulator with XRE-family HTH domain